MSLPTLRRPRHAYRAPEAVEQPDQVALLRAEIQQLTAQRDRAIRAAEHWGRRAEVAETTLRYLPLALANPAQLVRQVYADRDRLIGSLHADIAALRAQLQPTTEPKDGDQ